MQILCKFHKVIELIIFYPYSISNYKIPYTFNNILIHRVSISDTSFNVSIHCGSDTSHNMMYSTGTPRKVTHHVK